MMPPPISKQLVTTLLMSIDAALDQTLISLKFRMTSPLSVNNAVSCDVCCRTKSIMGHFAKILEVRQNFYQLYSVLCSLICGLI